MMHLPAKETIDWGRLPAPARQELLGLHRAFCNAFAGPEGQRALDYLRGQCFMSPGLSEPRWEGPEQVVFRHSRMTLFQKIEFLLDEANFRTG